MYTCILRRILEELPERKVICIDKAVGVKTENELE